MKKWEDVVGINHLAVSLVVYELTSIIEGTAKLSTGNWAYISPSCKVDLRWRVILSSHMIKIHMKDINAKLKLICKTHITYWIRIYVYFISDYFQY